MRSQWKVFLAISVVISAVTLRSFAKETSSVERDQPSEKKVQLEFYSNIVSSEAGDRSGVRLTLWKQGKQARGTFTVCDHGCYETEEFDVIAMNGAIQFTVVLDNTPSNFNGTKNKDRIEGILMEEGKSEENGRSLRLARE